MLVAEGIGKTHDGERMLFNNLTFTISAGDRLAVLGPNGAGKSTLLKIIAANDTHDSGTLNRNKGAKIGYLPQGEITLVEPEADAGVGAASGGASSSASFADDMTVLEAVLASSSEMARAVQDYQRALATADDSITRELEVAIERMNSLNAWQVDADAKRMLEAVGLANPNARVGSLSGGQRRRLAVAAALLGEPSLLVLDEPTNHMDVDMLNWMAREVTGKQDLALVVVSHDRAFMEATCNLMLELDGHGGAFLHRFGGPGSYEAFKEAREARRHAQANAAADARTLLRRETEWMSRQPKARQKKSKARQENFVELTAAGRSVPPPDVEVNLGNAAMARQGNKAIVMNGVTYQRPGAPAGSTPLIRDFTFEFLPGERLGIAGPNGVGKSTLLDLVAGSRQADAGTREVGETAVLGYFMQHPPPVDPDLRILDYIRMMADDRRARAAGSAAYEPPEILLERLGFPRRRQLQRVASLSGGERRRLHLAAVLVEAPNVLLLDEPTNDLDLATVEVLEEKLKSYPGVLLVVSHDCAFMENTTQRLLVLQGDGLVRLFQGGYADYLELLAERRAAEAAEEAARRKAASGERVASSTSTSSTSTSSNGTRAAAGQAGKASGSTGGGTAVASKAPAKPSKRTLGLYERQEYKRLGDQIEELSLQRDSLNARLMQLGQAAGGASMAELEEASNLLASVTEQIEEKSERWLELAEIAGDI